MLTDINFLANKTQHMKTNARKKTAHSVDLMHVCDYMGHTLSVNNVIALINCMTSLALARDTTTLR